MSIITIAKQIEPYSANSHVNACIVGTEIHLYYVESCLLGATKNEPRFMLKYNLDVTNFLISLLLVYNQASEKEYAAQ